MATSIDSLIDMIDRYAHREWRKTVNEMSEYGVTRERRLAVQKYSSIIAFADEHLGLERDWYE